VPFATERLFCSRCRNTRRHNALVAFSTHDSNIHSRPLFFRFCLPPAVTGFSLRKFPPLARRESRHRPRRLPPPR